MSSTAQIACQQFNIEGAGETITAVSDLPDVFAPPHHGPRNVPISVQLSEEGYSYTHFPIVRTGQYAIYLDTPGVFDGLIYGGTNQNTGTGTPIVTAPTDLGDCPNFAAGFRSADPIIFNNDDPQPIAIRFNNAEAPGKTIRYIVSLMDE